MNKEVKALISKELEQFHCSILLDEVKEKVRKSKAYGVDNADIVAVMDEGVHCNRVLYSGWKGLYMQNI